MGNQNFQSCQNYIYCVNRDPDLSGKATDILIKDLESVKENDKQQENRLSPEKIRTSENSYEIANLKHNNSKKEHRIVNNGKNNLSCGGLGAGLGINDISEIDKILNSSSNKNININLENKVYINYVSTFNAKDKEFIEKMNNKESFSNKLKFSSNSKELNSININELKKFTLNNVTVKDEDKEIEFPNNNNNQELTMHQNEDDLLKEKENEEVIIIEEFESKSPPVKPTILSKDKEKFDYKIKSGGIDNYKKNNSSFKDSKMKNYSDIFSSRINSQFAETHNELGHEADYCVKICTNDKIEILTQINSVIKIQRKFRDYINRNNVFYESKSSINNLSNVLKDDKSLKIPPELLKGNAKSKDKKVSTISSSDSQGKAGGYFSIHNKISENNKKHSKANSSNLFNLKHINNNSNSNNNDNSNEKNQKEKGIHCRFYKLKTDNKLIKKIKKFVWDNLDISGIMTLDNNYQKSEINKDSVNEKVKKSFFSTHLFGVKDYNNQSKVVGFFNDENKANGVAVYSRVNCNLYVGKIKYYFIYKGYFIIII